MVRIFYFQEIKKPAYRAYRGQSLTKKLVTTVKGVQPFSWGTKGILARIKTSKTSSVVLRILHGWVFEWLLFRWSVDCIPESGTFNHRMKYSNHLRLPSIDGPS